MTVKLRIPLGKTTLFVIGLGTVARPIEPEARRLAEGAVRRHIQDKLKAKRRTARKRCPAMKHYSDRRYED